MKKINGVLISFVLLITSFSQAVFADELVDVDGHRNEDAILYLYNNNIIAGYPDGTYKPNEPINRAELLKILVEARVGTPDAYVNKNCFNDVAFDWYAKYVCFAKNQGWVGGYPDGNFLPGKIVTKAEAIKMLLLSRGIKGDSNIGYDYFVDLNPNEWYYPFIVKAKKMFLTEELAGEFRPNEDMTRAKISEMLYRLLVIDDTTLEETTYGGKSTYMTRNGYINYYFDPTVFALTDVMNMYVRHMITLQRKSYDFVVRFLGHGPSRDMDFVVLSSDGKENSTFADSKKFVAYLKEKIKYENLKNLQFGLTGQFVLIFLAGDAVSSSWLAQGLASYVDNTYKYSPLGIKWVYCKDDGWEQGTYNMETKIGSSNGVLVKYSDFNLTPQSEKEANDPTGTNGFVRSGECFWDYVISKYGIEKFRSIVYEWVIAQETPSKKKLLIKDIINPVVGDDLSQLVKDRYNYTEVESVPEVIPQNDGAEGLNPQSPQ